MRNLIYSLQMSLDGYIAGPNGELDWNLVDEELHRHFNERERSTEIALYGRKLYELMTAYWPTADSDPALPPYMAEYAQIWRSSRKVVFSSTLERAEWGFRLVSGDAATEVARLKEEGDGQMLVGGAELGSSMLRAGLVDEVWTYVAPVIIGAGKPMFIDFDHHVQLRPVARQEFGCGVTMLRYEVDNALQD
jgi:dihydrofolate reductase